MNQKLRIAIFGASGAIGTALCEWFSAHDWDVVAISRTAGRRETGQGIKWIGWDPLSQDKKQPDITTEFNALVWAQGVNFNDDIHSFKAELHEQMYKANVSYIMQSLNILLGKNLLASQARLCVISSIWQNISRQNKLSYTVTKSALHGLVQSLMIDLGAHGHLINAVLPGALDTKMTRSNLTEAQIHNLEQLTPLNRLTTLDDVCNLVGYLCSSSNTGITGQFISADGGFSYARII